MQFSFSDTYVLTMKLVIKRKVKESMYPNFEQFITMTEALTKQGRILVEIVREVEKNRGGRAV